MSRRQPPRSLVTQFHLLDGPADASSERPGSAGGLLRRQDCACSFPETGALRVVARMRTDGIGLNCRHVD